MVRDYRLFALRYMHFEIGVGYPPLDVILSDISNFWILSVSSKSRVSFSNIFGTRSPLNPVPPPVLTTSPAVPPSALLAWMYLRTRFATRKLRGSVKVVERWAPPEPDILGMIAHVNLASVFLTSLASRLPSRLVSFRPVVVAYCGDLGVRWDRSDNERFALFPFRCEFSFSTAPMRTRRRCGLQFERMGSEGDALIVWLMQARPFL